MWKEMYKALPFSKLKTKAGSIILKCIARKKYKIIGTKLNSQTLETAVIIS
jgi:hypothetical protein